MGAGNLSLIESVPGARRLVSSLRDLGYDFVQAVADVVDNSIAAGATKVAITLTFSGPDSWVRIADNGKGMSGPELTEAMRYGTERTYDGLDLGKFGLGLKTASLSQCRKLTVASRCNSNERRIEVRCWDLDHVLNTNRWEMVNVTAAERDERVSESLLQGIGTVVLWEGLERILKYRVSWGAKANQGFLVLAERLDEHLAMVFHRFLSGEAKRRKKLSITINGSVVAPWDPFARDEGKTEVLQEQEFEVAATDRNGIVSFQPFVLPNRQMFSSETAFQRYAGPAKWNYQQGFYIYRADRMIQSGGWSRMRAPDEHTKLARIAINFYSDLDTAFAINVAKMSVTLPSDLKDQMASVVESVVKRAKAVYNKESDPSSAPAPTSASPSTQKPLSAKHGSAPQAPPARAPEEVNYPARVYLEQAAKATGESTALGKIAAELRKFAPEVADELGW
jgi:hypothetical protein